MNRERNLTGSNGYTKELGFHPLDFLKEQGTSGHRVAWLDLCCGTGKALIEAARITASEGWAQRLEIVGVDLVGMFLEPDPGLENLRLVEASLRAWQPARTYDLVTCVHGLHYVGDKLGTIARALSWLTEDGKFAANLDLENVRLGDPSGTKRTLFADLRRSGLEIDRRRRLLVCRGRTTPSFPYRYLGSNDQAGPNYTGQPAVDSYYEIHH